MKMDEQISLFQRAVLIFLPHECYDEFFVNFNFLNVTCLKIFLSKGLGVGIILGSILVKLPQILKVLAARSAEGISFLGVVLELAATTASTAYSYANSFPFSSYGEGLFLLIQTCIIGALVLLYRGNTSKSLSFVFSYSAILYFLVSGFTPMVVLGTFQACNVPIIVSSKTIQAITNYRNQSTGQLSAITVFLMFAGSAARIFTSVQETGDVLLIATFVCSSLANGVLAAQMVYYWNRKLVSESGLREIPIADKKTD